MSLARRDVPIHRVSVRRVYLSDLHATEAASDIAFARHTHDRFGIGVIRRGAQRSASGRGTVEAGAGDIITVNPGEVHDGAPLGGPRAWRMVYIEPALVRGAAAEASIASPGLVELRRPVLRDAALAQAFDRLFDVATDPGADPLGREEALTDLLARLLARHASTRVARVVAPRPSVARARERLDDDPAAPVCLAELAAAAGMSRFQLLRAFARETGLPPHAYRLSMRVQRARRLIQSGMPLAEAALAAGFGDQSHMNRAFLRHTGATPGAWAAAARG